MEKFTKVLVTAITVLSVFTVLVLLVGMFGGILPIFETCLWVFMITLMSYNMGKTAHLNGKSSTAKKVQLASILFSLSFFSYQLAFAQAAPVTEETDLKSFFFNAILQALPAIWGAMAPFITGWVATTVAKYSVNIPTPLLAIMSVLIGTIGGALTSAVNNLNAGVAAAEAGATSTVAHAARQQTPIAQDQAKK